VDTKKDKGDVRKTQENRELRVRKDGEREGFYERFSGFE
jgi:hypothetical protein